MDIIWCNLQPASQIKEGHRTMENNVIISIQGRQSFEDQEPEVIELVTEGQLAPDGEDAVSMLPGHRLLLKGRGMEAVRAAAIGSLVGAAAAVLIAVPLQILLSGPAGEALDSLTPLVLILVSGILLVSEHRRGSGVWGPVAFCVSGLLGLMCMTVPASFDGILGEDGVMMPLLTGLFGIPVLLEGTGQARIPRQSDRVRDPVGAVPGLKGVAMGAVAGWFSGITSTVGA